MSVTVFGPVPYVYYGRNPDKPQLPEGWEYFERDGHWLIAQSPDGKYWYAGKSQLCRMKFASHWDVIRSQVRSWFNRWMTPFEEGDHYADTREIIDIPKP